MRRKTKMWSKEGIISKIVKEETNKVIRQILNEDSDKYVTDLRNYFNKTEHEKNLTVITRGLWYDQIKEALKYFLNNDMFGDADKIATIQALQCANNCNLEETANTLKDYPKLTEMVVDYIKRVTGRNYVRCSCERMDYIRDVENEWLIHFTPDSESIGKEGFKYGLYTEWDYRNYMLSSHFSRLGYEDEEGYNFAYELDGEDCLNVASNLDNYLYGTECVVFQASGVEIYHQGDKDKQVIFWGPNAKNIITIKQEEGLWYAKSVRKNREILISEKQNIPLKNIIEWCAKNIGQLCKQLEC